MPKIFISLLVVVSSLASVESFAVEMKVQSCWKGYSQREQSVNLSACKKSKQPGEFCSSNWGEHGGAVFDVCKMVPAAAPQKIVQLFKGFRQSEQNQNLSQCLALETFGRICVVDWSVHRQAIYDVALME